MRNDSSVELSLELIPCNLQLKVVSSLDFISVSLIYSIGNDLLPVLFYLSVLLHNVQLLRPLQILSVSCFRLF